MAGAGCGLLEAGRAATSRTELLFGPKVRGGPPPGCGEVSKPTEPREGLGRGALGKRAHLRRCGF